MRPTMASFSALRTLYVARPTLSVTLIRSNVPQTRIAAITFISNHLHTSAHRLLSAASSSPASASSGTVSGDASAVDPTGSAATLSAAVDETVDAAGAVGVGAGAGAGKGSSEGSEGTESAAQLRLRAIKLYKELHRLGRDYPDPEYGFNRRLRRAYEKNSKETDVTALKKQLDLAEHIKKEVLALISLKKFRHLRRSYHANEGPR